MRTKITYKRGGIVRTVTAEDEHAKQSALKMIVKSGGTVREVKPA